MTRRWQGTALFAAIMAGLSVAVAGRALSGDGLASESPAAGSSQAVPSTGQGASGATPAATATPGATGATSAAGAPVAAISTVAGRTEQTRFGPVQVSVTFDGSKITAVTTLQAPNGSGRDEMLTRYATPQLAKEVIASQSARVDTVSGATYTSAGYLTSVQSAIDAHT
jgi:uncharacterized protein with FMN-binding domain